MWGASPSIGAADAEAFAKGADEETSLHDIPTPDMLDYTTCGLHSNIVEVYEEPHAVRRLRSFIQPCTLDLGWTRQSAR